MNTLLSNNAIWTHKCWRQTPIYFCWFRGF